jgi:hypothetical protein
MGSAMTLETVRDKLRAAGRFVVYNPGETVWAEDLADAIDAHLAEKAGARVDGWMPIESAPKDVCILVYPGIWVGKVCSIAKWNDDRYSKKPRPYWERDDGLRASISHENPPTHWMPLPPGPAA